MCDVTEPDVAFERREGGTFPRRRAGSRFARDSLRDVVSSSSPSSLPPSIRPNERSTDLLLIHGASRARTRVRVPARIGIGRDDRGRTANALYRAGPERTIAAANHFSAVAYSARARAGSCVLALINGRAYHDCRVKNAFGVGGQ